MLGCFNPDCRSKLVKARLQQALSFVQVTGSLDWKNNLIRLDLESSSKQFT